MLIRVISYVEDYNYVALAVLFLLIGLLVAFNLDFLGSGLGIASEAISGKGHVDLNNTWKVAALLFWAFLGWENLSFSLGEIQDPEKNRTSPLLAEFCPCDLYLPCSCPDLHRNKRFRRSPSGCSRAFRSRAFYARRKPAHLAHDNSYCSKRLFLELYCKPPALCRRQDRDLS